MAVTRSGQTIRMTGANDEVTGNHKVLDIQLDHSGAANASLGDSADFIHARIQTTTSRLCDQMIFPKGLMMNGIKAVALSAGTLIIHIE